MDFQDVVARAQAQTVARDVMVRERGYHPLILEAGTALVIVSFNEPPPALYALVDAKAERARDAAPTLEQKDLADAMRPPEATKPEQDAKAAVAQLQEAVQNKSASDGKVAPTIAPVVPVYERTLKGPVGDARDLDEAAFLALKNYLNCAQAGGAGDIADVCGWVDAFQMGDRPALGPKDGPYYGRSYLIDQNHRFVEAFYDAFIPWDQHLGRTRLKPTNATEDYELRSIAEAARHHTGIPNNPTLERFQNESRKTLLTPAPTKGFSVVFKDASRSCFLRQSSGTLLMLCTTSLDRLEDGEWVIGGFY